MPTFKEKVLKLMKLNNLDMDDLCNRLDCTEDIFTENLDNPENISRSELIHMSEILGVGINYFRGIDFFVPQVRLPFEQTDNGVWGVVKIQLKQEIEPIYKVITKVTLLMIQAQVKMFYGKPGVLVIPTMDNTVLYLRTDRVLHISFINYQELSLNMNDLTIDVKNTIKEFPSISANHEYMQLTPEEIEDRDFYENDDDDLFDLAFSGTFGFSDFTWEDTRDQNSIILTDGNKLELSEKFSNLDGLLDFCRENLGLYRLLRDQDLVVPWKSTQYILDCVNQPIDPKHSYHMYWPTMLEVSGISDEFCFAIPMMVNMSNVAMIEVNLAQLEVALASE